LSKKSVALIVPPMATSDMTLLLNALGPFGVSLGIHAPKRFDRSSLYDALLAANSHSTDLIISMLPLPFEREIVGNAIFPKKDIDKFTQFKVFEERSIPTLATMLFKFGMKFPGAPLDIVTLKPSILDTSDPHSMITLRNGVLQQLVPGHFKPDHLIHRNPYVVQEFIETGAKPTSYRVVLFCGIPLTAYQIVSRRERPILSNNDVHVGPEFISNNSKFNGYDVQLVSYPEMLKIAVDMSFSVGHPPLTKCDLLYSDKKGWRALEVSSTDFNGWPLGRRKLVDELGRYNMIKQFDVFNAMAERIAKLVSRPRL
jgi:hypothetical protein